MQQQHRDALINKINLNVLEEKGIGGWGEEERHRGGDSGEKGRG